MVEGKVLKFDLHTQVYHLHVWSFAYKQARVGHWEQFARDRDRFNRRIKRVEPDISLILLMKHREKIYRLRFQYIEHVT